MKSFFKRVLLLIIDAVTLYLSYYVSYLILNLLDMQTNSDIIQNAYIFVGIKIAVYLIFFMYSLSRYRSFFLDVLGVLAANAAAIFAANYLYDVIITDNLAYFGVVIGFDLLISIMVRFLVRTSGTDEEDYDDDEEDEDLDSRQNTLYQSGIFDPNYKPTDPSLQQIQSETVPQEEPAEKPMEPDPELIALQQEKDKKIDTLMAELQEKEQRIAILENKIAMQPDYPIYSEPQQSYQSQEETIPYQEQLPYGYQQTAYQTNGHINAPVSPIKTYADEHKREILDKILDDIKTLYSTLNSRSRLVEEREYNMLLKMVELEERERTLEELQRCNDKIFPITKEKLKSRKKSTFSPVSNIPSDNPDLAKNILRTIEELDSVSAPPITLANAPQEEYRPIINNHTSNNTIDLTQMKPAGIPERQSTAKQVVDANSVSQSPLRQENKQKEPLVQRIEPAPKPETPLNEIRQPNRESAYQPEQKIRPSAPQLEQQKETSLESLLRQQNQLKKQLAARQQQMQPVKTAEPMQPIKQPQSVPIQPQSSKPQTIVEKMSHTGPTGSKPISTRPTQPDVRQQKTEPKQKPEEPKKSPRSEIDFNTISLDKVRLEADELDQISSLIDDL